MAVKSLLQTGREPGGQRPYFLVLQEHNRARHGCGVRPITASEIKVVKAAAADVAEGQVSTSIATQEANGRPQRVQQGPRKDWSDARQERHMGIREAVSSTSPQSRQGAGKNNEASASQTSCTRVRRLSTPAPRGLG